MRWRPDEVDGWCSQWASERRKIVGLAELQPTDRIGRLSGTLGAVREEGEGASQGITAQRFPEVYTGTALLVNRAWKEMEVGWRIVMEAHYVFLFDETGARIKANTKAHRLNLTPAIYWKYVTFAKNFVHSFVILGTKYETIITERQNTLANA